MNNGRMWTVVNPTIGLPLLLGGVIVVSLIVHSAILGNTDWFPAFFSGGTEVVAE
jgi:light-harvesting protein B-800-850 alpha chain